MDYDLWKMEYDSMEILEYGIWFVGIYEWHFMEYVYIRNTFNI